MDTEVGKNLPARVLYLKKKVNKETFYVSCGYNVDNPPIDRSVQVLVRHG